MPAVVTARTRNESRLRVLRPVNFSECRPPVTVLTRPFEQRIWNLVMGEPFAAGAFQLMVANFLPAAAVGLAGVAGGPAGTTSALLALAAPDPLALDAGSGDAGEDRVGLCRGSR